MHAIEYGYHLAKQIKADVILCNAFILPAEVPQSGLVGLPIDDYDKLVEENEVEIAKIKTHLECINDGEVFKPSITFFNEVGSVADVVSHIATEKKCDLVVSGTHQPGWGTILIGNHSKILIDCIHKPLLLVPLSAKIKIPRRIAFATDFKHPEDDLELACSIVPMAASLEAEIYITHVYNIKHVDQNIPDRMAQFVNYCANKTQYPFIYASIINNDQPISGFDKLCADGDVDLLVMVHRPHSLFSALFNGSCTQKMAAHINIPLLVLPSLK